MRAICGLGAVLLALCCVGLGRAEDAKPARILMLTQSKGFQHHAVKREGEFSTAELAMRQLGVKSGLFHVDATQDAEQDFRADRLKDYDIVMFYTTGHLPIVPADMDYFLNTWLKTKGHGFIGFHSATDTYADFPPYRDMINGTFDGHPWNADGQVTLTVHDPQHPTMQSFGAEYQCQDEIYQYKHFDPAKVRVLMSLNMAKCDVKKPYHVPVAWVREWGEGRIFYTNLGHRDETWSNPQFLAGVTNAVKWVRGDVPGDATPNPEVSAKQHALAQEAAK